MLEVDQVVRERSGQLLLGGGEVDAERLVGQPVLDFDDRAVRPEAEDVVVGVPRHLEVDRVVGVQLRRLRLQVDDLDRLPHDGDRAGLGVGLDEFRHDAEVEFRATVEPRRVVTALLGPFGAVVGHRDGQHAGHGGS